MAGLTPILEDRGDIDRIVHRADLGRRFGGIEMGRDGRSSRSHPLNRRQRRAGGLHPRQAAAGDVCRRHRHGSRRPRQDRIDGVGEVPMPGLGPREVIAILIVDRASIANPSPGIEQNRFVGSFDEQGVGLNVADVVQDREPRLPLVGPCPQFLRCVPRARGDPEEPHAPLAVVIRHLGQPRQILLAQRTARGHEHEHDSTGRRGPNRGRQTGVPRSEAVEPDLLPGLDIDEPEIPDPTADQAIERQDRLGGRRRVKEHHDPDHPCQGSGNDLPPGRWI